MKRTKKFAWETDSARETGRWGEALGAALSSGICMSLVGPLGAGKTVLVGGVCRGLGVDEEVLSPTFVLYEEFSGRLPVVHVDLYRLEHDAEIEELGVFDAIGAGKVILAEWGDRSETLLTGSDAVIEITHASNDGRVIAVECTAEAAGVFEELESW